MAASAATRPSRLPEGAVVMTLGLLVAGVCVYAFLALSARDLGRDDYAPLAVLWALVFLAGPGLFFPLEQETARAVAVREARGAGSGPVVTRAAGLGLAIAGTVAVVFLLAIVPLADALFGGARTLVLAFVVTLPGYAAVHVLRGAYLGAQRFRAAGALIASEGAVRLTAGVAVALAGGSTTAYALVVGLTPLAVVGVALAVAPPELESGDPHPWAELSSVLGALLAASVFATTLLNAGPVITRLSVDDEAVVTLLFAGLLLVRPPLYLWQGVASALLPALTRAAEAGRPHEVRTALGRLALAVVALAVVSVAAVLAVGPEAGALLFGEGFALERPDLVLLTVATCAYMLALALGQGLIALRRAPWAAGVWGIGLAVLVGLTLADPGSARTVEAALLVGCVIAAVGMALPLARPDDLVAST